MATPTRRRRRRPCVLAALGLTLVLVACGRKEPPKPPPSRVPAPVLDLTAQQRGDEVLLRMSYPTLTIGGLALDEFEAVEIWEMIRPVPPLVAIEPALGPAPEDDYAPPATVAPAPAAPGLAVREDLILVDPAEFLATAALRLRLQGPELEAATSGASIAVRLPFGEPPPEPVAAEPTLPETATAAEPTGAPESEEDEEETAEERKAEYVHVFATKISAGRRLVSSFSNLVKLIPAQPPPPPDALSLDGEAGGVRLRWSGEPGDSGFHVYRRDAQSRSYGPALHLTTGEVREYLDASAAYGARYIYAVTTVATARPVRESALSPEREIDYQDRFPPPTPTDLLALPESGRVRLLWEAEQTPDLAGYRVYRQEADGDFIRLGDEPYAGLEYLDSAVASGRSYRYRVTALDRIGNESEASETIEVRVP